MQESVYDVFVGALGNTVIGFGTVFIILILIALIIYAFKIIPYLESKAKNKQTGNKVLEAPAKAAPATVVAEDVPVAVIMAAIAAYTEETGSTDGFVVRSIKRRV